MNFDECCGYVFGWMIYVSYEPWFPALIDIVYTFLLVFSATMIFGCMFLQGGHEVRVETNTDVADLDNIRKFWGADVIRTQYYKANFGVNYSKFWSKLL